MIQPAVGGAFSGSIVTRRLSSGMPWYTLRYDSTCHAHRPELVLQVRERLRVPGVMDVTRHDARERDEMVVQLVHVDLLDERRDAWRRRAGSRTRAG